MANKLEEMDLQNRKLISYLKDNFEHFYEGEEYYEFGWASNNFDLDSGEGHSHFMTLYKDHEKGLLEQFENHVDNLDPKKERLKHGFGLIDELEELKESLTDIKTRYFEQIENSNQTKQSLLGTVIYEPENPKQQVLLVKDLTTNNEQELNITKNGSVEYNNRNYNLKDFLSEKNYNELQSSMKQNQPTSFLLSKNELNKMQQQNLISIKQAPEKSELDALKDELSTLKSQNKGLKNKFETVEKFFNQDKTAMKNFNQFLNNGKELNSPEKQQDKELVANKKIKKGIEL